MEEELVQEFADWGSLLFEVGIDNQWKDSYVDELRHKSPQSQHSLFCWVIWEGDWIHDGENGQENDLVHNDQNDVSCLCPPEEVRFCCVVFFTNRLFDSVAIKLEFEFFIIDSKLGDFLCQGSFTELVFTKANESSTVL